MKHLIVTVVVAVMLAPGCTREATKGEAMKSSESPGRKPPAGKNRLAFEKSPYLLQHADNPVDWYPWGDEAFTAAREQGKPIFLSIGYSTCHWCHVMEHESFEDPQVAALMNDAFVCIKVDREERPDIDGIYMTVCQMMTQRGGWPLTILMTADRKPFFAGTYLPRETMLTFVPRVKNLWLTEREKIVAEADRVTGILRQSVASSAGDALGVPELDLAYTQLSSRFDSTWGGFGDQPKFPTPHNLLFLLRYGQRSGDARALQMVERTLTMMRRGGVYDHVGFGFHRYSTDARWFLPHFEKMLYDQALLVMCYAEAWQATGKPEYRKTAEEIIAYVLRDMTDAGGGFYSAEDADSEGEEGKFYLWTEAELRGLLGADAEGFAAAYGVTAGGNYAEEASGEHKGTSILYQPRSVGETAKARKMDGRTLEASLESSRRVLFDVREKRVHPYKDDKILADWNGLMIAALAEAGRIFDSKEYVAAAERAATFVLSSMKNKDGGIYHRFRDGESSIDGMLDDYAMMVWGLIELYQATFRTEYLERAIAYSNLALDRFWDDTGGAFYFAEAGGADLIVRQKESYDGAVPSGNSVSMLNLVRLGRITAKPEWEQRARDIGRAFHSQVSRAPSAYTQMMIAVDFQAGPSFEVVVAGREDAEDTRAMMRALETKYAPRRVVVFRPEGNADAVIRLAPYTKAQTAIEGRATAYVCRNYACELPTVDPLQMQRLMASP